MSGTVQRAGLSEAHMYFPPIRPESPRARDRASVRPSALAFLIFCLRNLRSALHCPRSLWLLPYFWTRMIASPEPTPTIESETKGDKRPVHPSSQSQGTERP